MKRIIKYLHQWLGLISGLLVFIIAITGSLYAFQSEIQDATQPYRFVSTENKNFIPPSRLQQTAKNHLPNKKLHSVKYFTENRSAQAIFYDLNPTYYYIVYLNPYSGKILHTQNMEEGFFPFILKGHFYLWLPPYIGNKVVASATLVFFLLMITGLILWIPKNIKKLKHRLWFDWNKKTRWKRKNFDLHNILGFYVFIIALIFITTGLVWGFQWFAQGYYTALGGKKSLAYNEPISNKIHNSMINPEDILYAKIISETENLKSIEVHFPETDSSAIAINTNTEVGTYWKTDYRYFDAYTLTEKKAMNIYGRLHDTTFADKLLRMNYDIHTGGILGLPGKIFMFLMSLIIASLPITGVVIWINKKKKIKINTDNQHISN